MISDLKKSIQLVLSERISSPFSGAFFFSWIVWNWKLLYYLAASDDKLSLNDRLSFVSSNFINLTSNLLYPLLSTIFLVLLYPFISTGSLWVWLKFKKWQVDLKNNIEKQQLLTLDQSLAIRFEIQNQEAKFDQLLKAKDNEIELLKQELVQSQSQINEAFNAPEKNDLSLAPSREDYSKEIDEFLNNQILIRHFPYVMNRIQQGYNFKTNEIPPEIVGYLTGSDIIMKKTGPEGFYEFTNKGKLFLREFSKRKLQQ